MLEEAAEPRVVRVGVEGALPAREGLLAAAQPVQEPRPSLVQGRGLGGDPEREVALRDRLLVLPRGLERADLHAPRVDGEGDGVDGLLAGTGQPVEVPLGAEAAHPGVPQVVVHRIDGERPLDHGAGVGDAPLAEEGLRLPLKRRGLVGEVLGQVVHAAARKRRESACAEEVDLEDAGHQVPRVPCDDLADEVGGLPPPGERLGLDPRQFQRRGVVLRDVGEERDEPRADFVLLLLGRHRGALTEGEGVGEAVVGVLVVELGGRAVLLAVVAALARLEPPGGDQGAEVVPLARGRLAGRCAGAEPCEVLGRRGALRRDGRFLSPLRRRRAHLGGVERASLAVGEAEAEAPAPREVSDLHDEAMPSFTDRQWDDVLVKRGVPPHVPLGRELPVEPHTEPLVGGDPRDHAVRFLQADPHRRVRAGLVVRAEEGVEIHGPEARRHWDRTPADVADLPAERRVGVELPLWAVHAREPLALLVVERAADEPVGEEPELLSAGPGVRDPAQSQEDGREVPVAARVDERPVLEREGGQDLGGLGEAPPLERGVGVAVEGVAGPLGRLGVIVVDGGLERLPPRRHGGGEVPFGLGGQGAVFCLLGVVDVGARHRAGGRKEGREEQSPGHRAPATG